MSLLSDIRKNLEKVAPFTNPASAGMAAGRAGADLVNQLLTSPTGKVVTSAVSKTAKELPRTLALSAQGVSKAGYNMLGSAANVADLASNPLSKTPTFSTLASRAIPNQSQYQLAKPKNVNELAVQKGGELGPYTAINLLTGGVGRTIASPIIGGVAGFGANAVGNMLQGKPLTQGGLEATASGAEFGIKTQPIMQGTSILVNKLASTVPFLARISNEAITKAMPQANQNMGAWVKSLGKDLILRQVRAALVETPIEGITYGTLNRKQGQSQLDSIVKETVNSFFMNAVSAGGQTLLDARTIKDVFANSLDGALKKHGIDWNDQGGFINIKFLLDEQDYKKYQQLQKLNKDLLDKQSKLQIEGGPTFQQGENQTAFEKRQLEWTKINEQRQRIIEEIDRVKRNVDQSGKVGFFQDVANPIKNTAMDENLKTKGWANGDASKKEFDTALFMKDAARVKELLPSVPDYYKQQFKDKITEVSGTDLAVNISPEKGKLNVENLNLPKQQKEAIRQLQNDVPVTVIGHKDIVDKSVLKDPRKTAMSDQQMADIMAQQLSTRQEVVTLSNIYEQMKKSGATEVELEEQLGKIADASRIAQQTGTFAGRLLNAQNILANEMATPQQRVFALLDNAGIDKEKYIKDATKVQWDNPTSVVAFYRKYVPSSLGEKLTEIRYSNMLSSPNTFITNASSNFLMTGIVRPVEKTVTGTLDWAKSGLTGSERKYFVSDGLDYAKGYYASLPKAWKEFKNVLLGDTVESKPDLERIPAFTSGVGKWYTLPLKGLEATDRFFKELVVGGEMATGSTLEQAKRTGDYTLFRQKFDPEGELGQGGLLKVWDKWNTAIQGLRRSPGGNWIVPFLQTPTNILKQGVEYSPLGALTIPGASKPLEQLSKTLIGSAVFTGAYGLAANNLTTWAAPTNPKEKELFYAAGIQPYSVKVGDKWVSYSKLGPLSYPIAMAAALKWAAEQNPDQGTIENVGNGLMGALKFFSDQSYVRSIGDFVSNLESGKPLSSSTLESQAANFAGQLVPYASFFGWVNRMLDPVYRKTGTGFDRITGSVPGLSQNVEPYTTPTGEVSTRDFPVTNAVSPVKVTQEKAQYLPEYEKQKQKVIDSGVITRLVKKEVEPKVAKAMKKANELLQSSPEYMGLSVEEKTKLLNDTESQVRSVVKNRAIADFIKNELSGKSKEEAKRILLKYEQSGILTQSVVEAWRK